MLIYFRTIAPNTTFHQILATIFRLAPPKIRPQDVPVLCEGDVPGMNQRPVNTLDCDKLSLVNSTVQLTFFAVDAHHIFFSVLNSVTYLLLISTITCHQMIETKITCDVSESEDSSVLFRIVLATRSVGVRAREGTGGWCAENA